jgi:hypothetical protein
LQSLSIHFDKKIGWATFWPIFSQTHLVALITSASLSIGFSTRNRVARWYIFKPKIQIWVNGLAIEDVGIFYCHLV